MSRHAEVIPFMIGDRGVETIIYPSSLADTTERELQVCRATGSMKPARIDVTLNQVTTEGELINFVYLDQLVDTYYAFHGVPPVVTIKGQVGERECNVIVRLMNNDYSVHVCKVS